MQPNFDFAGVDFYVGIDPQPTLLAVHVSSEEEDSLFWYQRILKKKVSSLFKTAEEWELYVSGETNQFVDKLDGEMRGHRSWMHGVSKIYCGVEQQRGRVDSILEAMLVSAGTAHGWIMSVPHPLTWKKSVGLTSQPGNKQNKRSSEALVADELKVFFQERNIKLPARIHDLCDAKLISEHVYMRYNQDNV